MLWSFGGLLDATNTLLISPSHPSSCYLSYLGLSKILNNSELHIISSHHAVDVAHFPPAVPHVSWQLLTRATPWLTTIDLVASDVFE